MKKRKMIVFLMFLMFGLGLMTNCDWFKNPTGPNNSEPTVKYDLVIKYIRIDVKRPELLWVSNIGCSIYVPPIPIADVNFTKIDDYNFRGEVSLWSDERLYAMYTVDPCRGDGINNSTKVVAERYIVKVKQTGFETELRDIRNNTVHPYGGKMACFRLTADGRIISDPQIIY